MGNLLRDRRSPMELAASGQVIDFALQVGDFDRLASIVQADLESLEPDKLPSDWRSRKATGQLRFGFAGAQGDLPKLEGRIAATLDAVCQRCLEPMTLQLAVELKLLFADSEPVENHDGFEIWELEDETFRPIDLVEEALIMAMPLAVMHDDSESCRMHEESDTDGLEMVRPFAALKAQMENDN